MLSASMCYLTFWNKIIIQYYRITYGPFCRVLGSVLGMQFIVSSDLCCVSSCMVTVRYRLSRSFALSLSKVVPSTSRKSSSASSREKRRGLFFSSFVVTSTVTVSVCLVYWLSYTTRTRQFLGRSII